MRQKNCYKVISGTLAVIMAVALHPVYPLAAMQNTDENVAVESLIGDALVDGLPETDASQEHLLEVKAEDENRLKGKAATNATEKMRLSGETEEY